MWDVVIAGAGPAGSVAAHVLARDGRRTLFVDANQSKHKVGEALPGAALRLLRSLDLPLPDSQGAHCKIGGNFSSWSSEKLVETDFLLDPDGQGWRLDRLRFDAALRESAIGSGATFKMARVTEVARQNDLWQLRLDSGETATARWLVDATGRSAALARRLGARPTRDTPLVALYAIARPKAEFRLNRTVVESVSGGWWYAGLLPSGAPLAGFHLRPEDAAILNAKPGAWHQALMATRHIAALFPNAAFDSPLRALDASGGRINRFFGDGWLACGDAALSFDPLAAQGIFSALYSGRDAGLAVAAALNDDPAAVDLYSRRLEEVRSIYLLRCQSIYSSETRWPTAPFWSRFADRGQTENEHQSQTQRTI